MTVTRLTSFALAVALVAAPALAQNATGPNTGTAAPGGTAPAVGTAAPGLAPAGSTGLGTTDTTTNPPGTMPAANTRSPNPALTENGGIRSSKVIGAAVYNDKDQKVGSVDDILLSKDHKAVQAVLSIGGVLGIGGKLVAVPFSQLQFPEQVSSDTSRVMMPGATENTLNGMPEFHYASR